jgi:hypothetical protein
MPSLVVESYRTTSQTVRWKAAGKLGLILSGVPVTIGASAVPVDGSVTSCRELCEKGQPVNSQCFGSTERGFFWPRPRATITTHIVRRAVIN